MNLNSLLDRYSDDNTFYALKWMEEERCSFMGSVGAMDTPKKMLITPKKSLSDMEYLENLKEYLKCNE